MSPRVFALALGLFAAGPAVAQTTLGWQQMQQHDDEVRQNQQRQFDRDEQLRSARQEQSAARFESEQYEHQQMERALSDRAAEPHRHW